MNNYIEKRKEIIESGRDVLFRKSALTRILLGTFVTTSSSLLFSYALYRYKHYSKSFIANWIKGSFTFSSAFYSLNEVLMGICKYYKVYTNFWINYTLISYNLSKIHYRYLIRNHMMKWYLAIPYSHKCFLYFCVLNMIIELVLFLSKEVYLYDEPDFLDILKDKKKEELTIYDIENHFMKGFYIINSEQKKHILELYIQEQSDLRSKFPNQQKKFTIKNKINLYELYAKNKKIYMN
jgi:hypothetical protein